MPTEHHGSVKPTVPLPRQLPIREVSQLGQILIHYWEARIRNKNARPASRRRPQGAGNDIRGRETVSSKQQIMKTLSNNYCNENYWGGKGSRQAVGIWLMLLDSGVKCRESARDGLFSFVFDMWQMGELSLALISLSIKLALL